MAASGKASSWGSFLSQAMAGVESRLDTILAEADDQATEKNSDGKAASDSNVTPEPSALPPPKAQAQSGSASGASRGRATPNRTNDRLQGRLARAVAAKATASHLPARPSQVSPTRSSIDAPVSPVPPLSETSASQKTSLEATRTPEETLIKIGPAPPSPQLFSKSNEAVTQPDVSAQPIVSNDCATKSRETEATTTTTTTTDSDGHTTAEATPMATQDNQVRDLEQALDESRRQHHQETLAHIERIDALEAKLQFLAREATESARRTTLADSTSNIEKKLAEKDQVIAQLMEEGKKLTSAEHDYRMLVKKLRAKVAENEKDLNSTKTAKAKVEGEVDKLRHCARRVDELEKWVDDLQRRLGRAQQEASALKSAASAKDRQIRNLESQLEQATSVNADDCSREQNERVIAELEDVVAELGVEKNLVADRARIQAQELREKADRANERARVIELEMKVELQAMESKLEAMRVRAEEASSGVRGDTQAKLLRQAETLQSQYSIASENWQRIEATHLARIATLERERDEAQQREADMRKKARQVVVRATQTEEELEAARQKIDNFEGDIKAQQSKLETLQKRAEEAEQALVNARAAFEKQTQSWKVENEELQARAESRESRSWQEYAPSLPFRGSNSRPESPHLSSAHRTLSADVGLSNLAHKLRKVSATASSANGDLPPSERQVGRRTSTQQHVNRLLIGHSHSSFTSNLENLPAPNTTSHPLDRDETVSAAFDEAAETCSSPRHVMQDMVSVSTTSPAGPSVQLVERMSAAIRRLESEKVATREDLTRISSQRDEGRAEILVLMRDVEAGKAAERRAQELEAQVAEVNARYETTLELLGEKSELVEELRADVEDVKAMYRELVESTVK